VDATKPATLTPADKQIIMYVAIAAASTMLCQGGTPVAFAHYSLIVSSAACYHVCLSGEKTWFTLKSIFWTQSLTCAVAASIITASSLPLKGPAIPVLFLYIGMQLALAPYLAFFVKDKLQMEGSRGDLLIPVFTVAVEYIHARIFPYRSYGILPYTQFGQTATMQLASLGGVWAIEAFVSFIASSAASILHSNDPKKAMPTVKRMILVFGLVQLFGGARLRFQSWEGSTNAPDVATARVAGVWVPHTMVIREYLLRHHLGHLVDGREGPGDDFDTEGWKDVVKWSLEDWAAAEVEIEREAAAGANIVMFPELCFTTFDGPGVTNDKVSFQALLKRLGAAAAKHNVFIGAGIGTNDPFSQVEGLSLFTDTVLEKNGQGMVGTEANRFMIFSPSEISKEDFDEVKNGAQMQANVALDYRKRNPVAIIEQPFGIEGNETVPVAALDIGGTGKTIDVGSVICFDMESPWHVQQLGKTASVILNPSYDWPGLNPYHARIVAFRAIETGTSIFHHCLAGTTIGVDYLGNVLSQSDYFAKNGDGEQSCVPLEAETRCKPPVNVAQLPMEGVVTVYAIVGDVLPYAMMAIAASLLVEAKWGVEGKKKVV
jgi:apolipoprotein N-acyltransferase